MTVRWHSDESAARRLTRVELCAPAVARITGPAGAIHRHGRPRVRRANFERLLPAVRAGRLHAQDRAR